MAKVRRAQILWKGATGQMYSLTLDATINETHTGTSTVTDHPVEKGSNVADHIRPDPDQLTMEAEISNTPCFLPIDHMGGVILQDKEIRGAQMTASDAIGNIPGGGAVTGLGLSSVPVPTGLLGRIGFGTYQTALVTGFTADFDRVTECYKELLRIRREGQLVRILTTLRSYDNMAMTSLEVTREAVSGNALPLSLAFKELRFGTTKNEPVPKIPVKAKPKGSKTKEEHEEEEEGDTSLLRLYLNKGR